MPEIPNYRRRLQKSEGLKDNWTARSRRSVSNTVQDKQKQSIQRKTVNASLPAAQARGKIVRPTVNLEATPRHDAGTLKTLFSKKTKNKGRYFA